MGNCQPLAWHRALLVLFAAFVVASLASAASAHPLDGIAKLWDRGSFDTPGESLQWHYEKHGREVGATDVANYADKAAGFYNRVGRDRWGSQRRPLVLIGSGSVLGPIAASVGLALPQVALRPPSLRWARCPSPSSAQSKRSALSGAPIPGETPNVRRFTRGNIYMDLYQTSSGARLIISSGAR